MKKYLFALAALLIAYVFVGALIDRIVFPEPEPGPEFYPSVGTVFKSRLEGFTQTILKREKGLVWVELKIAPNSPGPPEHIHTGFAEDFFVAEGTLSLMVNGEKKQVTAGNSLLVPPGTRHRPFNETDARVVIRGPLTAEYGIPDKFSVFLTQAYGYFDESESNSGFPRVLLQMSRFSPEYDSWIAGIPVGIQRVLYFAIGPTARLLGYRSYYEKYMPGLPGGK